MPQLDHLTVIAPSLDEGVAHVRACLGIEAPFGRVHPDMGTYNHLLRLGESVYLEIIAADPAAPRPPHPRWFGLGDGQAVRAAWDAGLRLRGWVARTDDMDAVLRDYGDVLGRKARLSGGGSFFLFSIPADGSLPLGGAAPSIIDRQGRPPPVAAMPDLGAELRSFVVEHPEPETLTGLYRRLRLDAPPEVRKGERLRFLALVQTPQGLRELS